MIIIIIMLPFLGQLPQEAGPTGTPPDDSCLFNTLMAESWLESVHCHKDRVCLGRDPRDS